MKLKHGEVMSEIILESEVGIDYSNLQDLLAAGKWQEADKETYRLVIKVSNCNYGYLFKGDWLKFPCKDLHTIDRLWVKYSNGRFGFSVQKQIWKSVGGYPERYIERDTMFKFTDKLGWRKGEKYLDYSDLTFNTNAQIGHLPVFIWLMTINSWEPVLYFCFMAERLVICYSRNLKPIIMRPIQETVELTSLETATETELSLESEKDIDYAPLRNLLADGKWKEADEETYRLLLKVANCEERQYLTWDHWLEFPSKDLRTIDRLWVKYSNGRFGFSVQKQIWEEVGGCGDAYMEITDKFLDSVGWRDKEILEYDRLTFNPTAAPRGHLPARWGAGWGRESVWLDVSLWMCGSVRECRFLVLRKDL